MGVDREVHDETSLNDRDHLLEQVTAQNVSQLRLGRASFFTPQRLVAHIAENPGLAWRMRDQNEYVIAGSWRHRADIGHILEMTYGRWREDLLVFILDAFRKQGAKLVVSVLDDYSLYLALYARFGFIRLDEIIELEQLRPPNLPSAPPVTIRKMLPADQPAVLAVDEAAFPWLWRNSDEEFSWYGEQHGVEIYVADPDGLGVVGYAGLTIKGREGHLDRLAVAPGQQGLGFGAALLRFSVQRVAQAGVHRMALSTQSGNLRSQRLYRWFGFKPTFRTQKIYGFWLDGGESSVE
ncbi:MAG: GNAT family N-acetyltransferase [Chloroflexi bacterium]|nr:GNAT family N-acetyltransferase [Chloroflexota bacterium]